MVLSCGQHTRPSRVARTIPACSTRRERARERQVCCAPLARQKEIPRSIMIWPRRQTLTPRGARHVGTSRSPRVLASEPPAGFILPCQPLLVDKPPAGWAGSRDQARRLPDHRPQGRKSSDPLEPPLHEFHRQAAEDRGGGLQFGCRQRPDRWRGGRISPGRAFRFCRLAHKGGLGAGLPCRGRSLPQRRGSPSASEWRSGEPRFHRSSPASTAFCSVTPWWPRERSCSPRPASWAWRGSSRSALAADIRAETAGSIVPNKYKPNADRPECERSAPPMSRANAVSSHLIECRYNEVRPERAKT